jgi:hypothetical protein
MQFIPEAVIDNKAHALGSAQEFNSLIQSLKDQQPTLLAYLFSPSFEMLTQGEKEYAMFLALIVWASVLEHHPVQDQITTAKVESIEEQNWQVLQEQKVKDFREKLTIFFEDYSQEDLLAFVEDALMHDEDDIITQEGRAYVFIALKTIIDCLDQSIDN